MQIIYRAKDITEAHIVAGLLRSNGIESYVGGHYLQGGIGDLAAFDFAIIQVDNDDIGKAKPIIAEYEGQQEVSLEPTDTAYAKASSPLSGLFVIFVIIIVLTIFYLVI